MSRDGYFPKIFLSTHPRFGTFYVTAALGSVLVIVLSVLGAIHHFLGCAASFGSLLVFALVNLSLMKLRKTHPYMERPFKTPLYPLISVLGVILSLAMLVAPVLFGDGNALDALTSGLGLVAIVLGSYYLRMTGRFQCANSFRRDRKSALASPFYVLIYQPNRVCTTHNSLPS